LSWGHFCGVIGPPVRHSTVSESVSFRISRTAEDLAQTVAALSKRLVSLEQRLGALEVQGASLQADLRTAPEADPAELACLDAVDQLLADCRSLLADTELPQAPLPQPPLPISEAPIARVDGAEPAVDADLDWDGLAEQEAPDQDRTGVEAGLASQESLTLAAG
jgi:hypothetical protein